MNIIVFPRKNSSAYSLQFSRWYHYTLIALILSFLGAVPLGLGYYLGVDKEPRTTVSEWRQDLIARSQQAMVSSELSRAHIDVLVQRLGMLQAHVNRLDALGSRLVKLANLDDGEFDFESSPGVGGPDQSPGLMLNVNHDISDVLGELALRLDKQESQFRVLDRLILSRNLDEEVFPTGWPIKKGWISSSYGKRKNPFNGKSEFHKGIDFAGKAGSDVIAVASGVVTWAGKRSGYGKLIEIDHGNRFSTRYGHNKKLSVAVGDVVKKGQVIAKMGSTGRSTGPHVHLEVLERGKQINPYKFISASK